MDAVCFKSLIEEPLPSSGWCNETAALSEALNSEDFAGDLTTDNNSSYFDKRQEGMLDRDLYSCFDKRCPTKV